MKIAETRPPYCAGCFQHPGENRCVDFEAAYDGPVIPGTPEPVPIDDLVLCEECLKSAFALLDPQHMRQTIDELEEIVKDLVLDNQAKDKMIQGARDTIGELVDHPINPAPGRPPLVGVSEEVRKMITKARFERRGTTSAPKNHRPDQKRRKEKVQV